MPPRCGPAGGRGLLGLLGVCFIFPVARLVAFARQLVDLDGGAPFLAIARLPLDHLQVVDATVVGLHRPVGHDEFAEDACHRVERGLQEVVRVGLVRGAPEPEANSMRTARRAPSNGGRNGCFASMASRTACFHFRSFSSPA